MFAKVMKAHLAGYKEVDMPGVPDGIHYSSGRRYAHILPPEMRELNILPSTRAAFWRYFKAQCGDVGLHTDFHHLNSSQAFAFNLFFPLMAERANHAAVLRALGVQSVELASWRFEAIPDGNERTAVDFYARYTSGTQLLCEVKLTESSFGSAAPNKARLAKRESHYLPALSGKIASEWLEEDKFFLNYQLLRNLSHVNLDRGDQLVFLMPRANVGPWAAAERFMSALTPAAMNSVRLVSVKDFLGRLQGDAPSTTHLSEFAAKYHPAVVA